MLYTQKLGNFEEKQHIYYLPNIISDVGNKSTAVMHYAYMQYALMTLVGEICISGTIKNCLNISVFSTSIYLILPR